MLPFHRRDSSRPCAMFGLDFGWMLCSSRMAVRVSPSIQIHFCQQSLGPSPMPLKFWGASIRLWAELFQLTRSPPPSSLPRQRCGRLLRRFSSLSNAPAFGCVARSAFGLRKGSISWTYRIMFYLFSLLSFVVCMVCATLHLLRQAKRSRRGQT